jgi:hypothetical protein
MYIYVCVWVHVCCAYVQFMWVPCMNGENGGLVTRISRIIQASSSVSVSSIEFFLQTDKHHVVQPAAYPSFCIQDPFSCSFTYHHVSMSTCVCAFVFTRWMYTSVLCICWEVNSCSLRIVLQSILPTKPCVGACTLMPLFSLIALNQKITVSHKFTTAEGCFHYPRPGNSMKSSCWY